MHPDHQGMRALAQTDQAGTQQGRGLQIELACGDLALQGLQRIGAFGLGQAVEFHPFQTHMCFAVDALAQNLAIPLEPGAQGIVASDHGVERRRQRRLVQRPLQFDHPAHQIRLPSALELVDQPQPALRRRRRGRFARRQPGDGVVAIGGEAPGFEHQSKERALVLAEHGGCRMVRRKPGGTCWRQRGCDGLQPAWATAAPIGVQSRSHRKSGRCLPAPGTGALTLRL